MLDQSVINFIVAKHPATQVRKLTCMPYLMHAFDTINTLGRWGVKDITTLKAMGGHDIVEENVDICRQEIVDVMGEKSTDIIYELTFLVTM